MSHGTYQHWCATTCATGVCPWHTRGGFWCPRSQSFTQRKSCQSQLSINCVSSFALLPWLPSNLALNLCIIWLYVKVMPMLCFERTLPLISNAVLSTKASISLLTLKTCLMHTMLFNLSHITQAPLAPYNLFPLNLAFNASSATMPLSGSIPSLRIICTRSTQVQG